MITRWFSVLLVLLYAGFCGFLFYESGSRAPVVSPVAAGHKTTLPPVKPHVATTQPFHIYYEKDPLPEQWLKDWSAAQHVKVVQSPLVLDSDGHWQQDGDLYIVSPRWLQPLESQLALAPLPDKSALKAVNPAFTAQPFDANNEVSVPWRWTPYVFYLRHDKDLPWEKNREVFYFREWVNDARCLWPNDWDLLLALQTHYSGKSANRHLDNYAELITALKEKYAAVTASETDCWQALLDGKIHFSFLPAAYKQKGVADEKLKDIEIQQPGLSNNIQSTAGTIVYLDQLVVANSSAYKDKAQTLIAYLLSPEQQQQLVKETGYFPVVSKIGHEFDFAPVPLPKDHWFNRSEFLINRAPEPPVPVVSGTLPQAEPVSPVAPQSK